MSQSYNNEDIPEKSNNSLVVIEPRLIKNNDWNIHIDHESLKKVFKEFVESNPEYVKQILSKIFKDKEN